MSAQGRKPVPHAMAMEEHFAQMQHLISEYKRTRMAKHISALADSEENHV